MIVLPIQPPTAQDGNDDDTPQEWSLLELNGELIPPALPPPSTTTDPTSTTTPSNSLELGSISFDDKGTPLMTIGAQELKGKIKTLDKPFIVMRPLIRKRSFVGQPDDGMEGNKRVKTEENKMEGYEVAGVISKKVLFDSYPKSIIH